MVLKGIGCIKKIVQGEQGNHWKIKISIMTNKQIRTLYSNNDLSN